MSADKNGGPAFPTKREALDPRTTGWMMEEGMSLRDWFAGQAMASMIGEKVSVAPHVFANEAAKAYAYADAMIEARSK